MKINYIIATIIAITPSLSLANDNTVTSMAVKNGVKKCAQVVRDISNFLIENGDAGSHGVWHDKSPDLQMFTSSIERNYSDGEVFSSLTVAPVTSGGCDAVYESVAHLNHSCLQASKTIFSTFNFKGVLNKKISILERNNIYVYLLPAGADGCIYIKKEPLYNWDKRN